MNKIYSFLTASLVILISACNPTEINNDTPQTNKPGVPDEPQQEGIIITASIEQTRVTYTDPGDKLYQIWDEGDILYGFYGDVVTQQLVLKVLSVGDNNEDGKTVATLGAATDTDAAILNGLTADTSVYLIYTGERNRTKLFEGGTFSVDMQSQDYGGSIPACMHASATLVVSDGNKSLDFHFNNDCAILEIESLPGVYEDGGFTTAQALSSIDVTNLILGGSYSYSEGSLVFTPSTSVTDSYDMDLSEKGWRVGSDGTVSNTIESSKKLLVAIAPNSEAKEIRVAATTSGSDSKTFAFSYGSYALDAGQCYVIGAKDVVAKTSDGQYFTSVSAAFDHAEELSDRYTTAADNVVTLIKKKINGFGEQTASQTHMSSIDIYSNVTLDLNGCTLSLSEAEGFIVNNIPFTPTTFTITDRNGLNDDEEYEGNIESTSSNPIIINRGDVIIDGVELYYTFLDDPDKYNGRYSMIDNEGGSLTIDNDSYLQADGSIPDDDDDDAKYYLIHNLGELEVNGGYLYSFDDEIITIGNYCNDDESGTVTINGGEVYSQYVSAIESVGGEVFITGGVISNKSTIAETIQILNGAECTISGGVIYSERDIATIVCRSTSEDEKNSKLWITWPIITNPDAEEPQYNQAFKEGLHEPLIYSFGSAYLSSPISTYNNNENNTAEVYIQGGYLLTHNERDYFFNDGVTPSKIGQTVTELLDNLKLSDCGNFYANSCRINLKGNTDNPTTYGKYLNSYPDTGQKFTITTNNVNYTPEFFADYFDEEDFASGFPKETVLYYFEYK